MKKYSIVPGFRGIYANKDLLQSLVTRDIQMRYRGTLLGSLWVIIYPLIVLLVYTFVFGGVFNARWTSGGGIKDYIFMLYSGLIVHTLFSEVLTRSPTAVLSYPSYVKKVVFPLELLPICHLGSAIFNALIGLGLLCTFLAIERLSLPPTALSIPFVFFPLILLIAGLAWFFAAIGIFFRDVGQIIGVVMPILLFLSPVFYPVSSAPALAQKLIYLNPLTYPIEELRAVLILGNPIDWSRWIIYFIISIVIAIFGFWFFQNSRPAFADVI